MRKGWCEHLQVCPQVRESVSMSNQAPHRDYYQHTFHVFNLLQCCQRFLGLHEVRFHDINTSLLRLESLSTLIFWRISIDLSISSLSGSGTVVIGIGRASGSEFPLRKSSTILLFIQVAGFPGMCRFLSVRS